MRPQAPLGVPSPDAFLPDTPGSAAGAVRKAVRRAFIRTDPLGALHADGLTRAGVRLCSDSNWFGSHEAQIVNA